MIAKVTRDRFMQRMEERYPGWEFAAHVGYSTPEHRAAIEKLGVSPLHRLSFQSMAYQQLALVVATFVLVHGAWHGGWCWRDVAVELRAAGHDVHVPTLSGCGEKASLARACRPRRCTSRSSPASCTSPICARSCWSAIRTAGCRCRAPPRGSARGSRGSSISTRSSPTDGQSLFDLLRPDRRKFYEESAVDGLVPSPPPEVFGVVEQRDWVGDRLTPQPLRTFTEPLSLARRSRRSRAPTSAAPRAR